MMEALPESRMILLVRDPRDVVASVLGAQKEGNWVNEGWDEYRRGRAVSAEKNVNAYVRVLSNRYEHLRTDALGTVRRLFSELGQPAEGERLRRAVEARSWEDVPTDEKGEGKFYLKGTPGGWREDLTPKQAEIVGGITADLPEESYP